MRFPVPLTRCDSPHRSSMDPSIPIVIKDKDGPEDRSNNQECCAKKSKSKRKENNATGVSRDHRAGVAMIAAKSYRQGYIDASSYHISHPVLPPVRAQYESVVPDELASIAAQHPYTTMAAIGLGAGFLLSASAYLGHRAFRSFATTSSGLRDIAPEFWLRKLDNLERRVTLQVQGATAENRNELEGLKRDIINHLKSRPSHSLPTAATTATAGVSNANSVSLATAEFEKKLKDLEGQVVASNRDRRSELQAFRSELMGQLLVLEDLTKARQPQTRPASEGSDNFPYPGKPVGKKEKQSTGDLAPIAPRFDEARLGQVLRSAVEDVLNARFDSGSLATGSSDANATNVQAKLDEIQGLLVESNEAIEHLSNRVDDLYEAMEPNFSLNIEDGTGRAIVEDQEFAQWAEHDSQNELFDSETEFHQPYKNANSAYPSPPSKPRSPKEQEEYEHTRADLYDKISEAKGRYQSIMATTPAAVTSAEQPVDQVEDVAIQADSVLLSPVGTPASDIAEGLRKAAQWAKERDFGVARAAENNEEPSHTASSARTTTSINGGSATARTVEDDLSAFPANAHAPNMGTLEHLARQIKDEARAKLQSSAQGSSQSGRTVSPGPRLGIDDSGSWSFVIPNLPAGGLRGAGWRNADVVYEKGQSLVQRGRTFIFSSSSSGLQTYNNVKIFFYPEFDIARLDGHLWRCTREGAGKWAIREKLGEAKEPEWDGVGYEKD